MIPLEPKSPIVIWFNCWRAMIAYAKEGGPNQEFYERQACNSQMMYLCYVAVELAKENSNGPTT